MTAKKLSKTLQAESEELYYKSVYTQIICPDDRSFQCRRKYRHSADMHRNNTEGMEYNTNIRKKKKLNNILCTEIEI